jgi:hypothetical protein
MKAGFLNVDDFVSEIVYPGFDKSKGRTRPKATLMGISATRAAEVFRSASTTLSITISANGVKNIIIFETK